MDECSHSRTKSFIFLRTGSWLPTLYKAGFRYSPPCLFSKSKTESSLKYHTRFRQALSCHALMFTVVTPSRCALRYGTGAEPDHKPAVCHQRWAACPQGVQRSFRHLEQLSLFPAEMLAEQLLFWFVVPLYTFTAAGWHQLCPEAYWLPRWAISGFKGAKTFTCLFKRFNQSRSTSSHSLNLMHNSECD